MTSRRTLLIALGANVLATPLLSVAQQPNAPAGPPGKIWRVGFLSLPIRPANLDTHYLVFMQHRARVAQLALQHRLPFISAYREYVEAGGLLSYGPSLSGLYRLSATYVDQIFKGAKPAGLPVQQPTIIEMYINGRTAKALGLKLPQSLLISADKIIE